METIKYLGWRQPYATMMLPPHNKGETRTRRTHYRGLVLITASKQSYDRRTIDNISGIEQSVRIWKAIHPLEQITGHAIAVGRLIDCRPMTKADEDLCYVKYREPWQVISKSGRRRTVRLYVWIFADVKPIEPFEMKGAQGFRTLDAKTKSKIKYLQP